MILKNKRYKTGPVAQKVLLLLMAGLALSITKSPRMYHHILKSTHKEWKKINQKSLRQAIKSLYQSKMIDYKEEASGVVTIVLEESGKKKALQYNLDDMKLKKTKVWDKLWRIVMFDIPEHHKQARNALAARLKTLGFYKLQKSVFIYPHDCKDEVNFIIEIFNVKPFVIFVIAKETDIDLDLKIIFDIL